MDGGGRNTSKGDTCNKKVLIMLKITHHSPQKEKFCLQSEFQRHLFFQQPSLQNWAGN